MTPAELALARDGDGGASAGSVALWTSIVGDDTGRSDHPETCQARTCRGRAGPGERLRGLGYGGPGPDACGGRFSDRFVPVSPPGRCSGFTAPQAARARRMLTRLGAAIPRYVVRAQ